MQGEANQVAGERSAAGIQHICPLLTPLGDSERQPPDLGVWEALHVPEMASQPAHRYLLSFFHAHTWRIARARFRGRSADYLQLGWHVPRQPIIAMHRPGHIHGQD